MDLDPMINTSQDENNYLDYDDRPIRPMDQDALNEALARLPILVDDDELMKPTDPNTSIKARRQPVLAYSTRRKNFSGVNINQTVLNMTETPINNKRKLVGCTATNKLIKQLDPRQDIINLKEENKTLEEAKISLEIEYALLKSSHETELETLKQEHEQAMESLIQEHNLQCEELKAQLADKEQLLIQTNIELENLRNDQTMLLLEKETLDNIVAEYQLIKEEMNKKLIESETTIKKLHDELENMKNLQQQKKQETAKTILANGRMPIKEKSTNRVQIKSNPTPTKKEPIRTKPNSCSIATIPTSLNKSTSSSCSSTSVTKPPLIKSKVLLDDNKKKSVLTDKQTNIAPKATKPKTNTVKSS